MNKNLAQEKKYKKIITVATITKSISSGLILDF